MQLVSQISVGPKESPVPLLRENEPPQPGNVEAFLRSIGLEHTEPLTQETGLTNNDLTVLTACAAPEALPRLTDALSSYAPLRDTFFAHPEDATAYQQYRDCLLTLIYPDRAQEVIELFNTFEQSLGDRPVLRSVDTPGATDLRRAVMYELYVDLFAKNADGPGTFALLEEQLPYLSDLGITHLWILPPFESPGHDAGFDIRDRRQIAEALGGNGQFKQFVQAAADCGISVMVDMVLNHLSYESAEFQAAIDVHHPDHDTYKDWFIFRDGTRDTLPEDLPAWVIFGDMHMPGAGSHIFPDAAGKPKKSNWTWVEPIGKWVYHRFMPHMPDVNFTSPRVLLNELSVMDHWIQQTQAPLMFRYDALRHIQKLDRHAVHPAYNVNHPNLGEVVESYQCDNLPQTHLILRLLRTFAQHRYPGVHQVSEVWDTPDQVRRYSGPKGEGTHQFGFDLMSKLVQTFYRHDARPLNQALLTDNAYPPSITNLGLLRHHDAIATKDVADREMEAEMARLPQFGIPETVIATLSRYYPDFDKTSIFEETGISARLRLLVEAMEGSDDPEVILPATQQALALLFFAARTPMIYMGDEVATQNDYDHLLKKSIGDGTSLPGIDMRHAHRTMSPLESIKQALETPTTLEARLFGYVKNLIALRRRDELAPHWHETPQPVTVVDNQSGVSIDHVFAAFRQPVEDHLSGMLMLANLSGETVTIRIPDIQAAEGETVLHDLLRGTEVTVQIEHQQPVITLPPKATYWLTDGLAR